MGTNLLGRGALVTLDAGLCDLAVSPKSVREGAFRESKLAPRVPFTSTPCLGIVGRDQRKDGLQYQKE